MNVFFLLHLEKLIVLRCPNLGASKMLHILYERIWDFNPAPFWNEIPIKINVIVGENCILMKGKRHSQRSVKYFIPVSYC